MTDLTKLLLDEHQKLVRTFADNPYIAISFSDGDSPRKYEVEYKIKGGVRQEDGSVRVRENHRVAILLPFGYPNFPPNCKPLTPIFHPDFDSAAICISDFWGRSKSLPDLIIHIGLMISGQVFGTGNTFNPEAARWYQEKGDRLPFDSVDLRKVDDDLVIEIVEDLPSQPYGHDELELNLDDGEFPSLEEVDNIIGDQIVFNEEMLSGKNDAGGEEGLILELERSEREREEKVSSEIPLSGPPAKATSESSDAGEREVEAHVEDVAHLYAAEQGRKKKKNILIAKILAICMAALVAVYFLAMDILRFNKAEGVWQEAELLLDQQSYKEVKKRGDLALLEIGKIKVIKKSAAEGLKQKIETMFKTEEFQGGLAGKVLYDGIYIDKKNVAVREEIKTALEGGNRAAATEKWDAAILSYQEAQRLARSIQFDDQETLKVIEGALAKSRLNLFIEKGSEYLDEEKLDDAVTSFQKAIELANRASEIEPKRKAFINQSLDRALLQKFIKEGEGAFTAIQLNKALNSFRQALLLAEKEASAVPEYAEDIRKSIQQVKLYQLLEKGKIEYEALRWDEALLSFKEALRFIVDEDFGHGGMAANETAIRKKILQIEVKISENRAADLRQGNRLWEAVQEFQRVIDLVNSSQYRKDDEFTRSLERARAEIASLNSAIDVAQKINYLTENYQEIFKANHSLAHSATLRNPVVVFVEQEGENQLYKLKCMGHTTTGQISLELSYMFAGDTKKWALYNKR